MVIVIVVVVAAAWPKIGKGCLFMLLHVRLHHHHHHHCLWMFSPGHV